MGGMTALYLDTLARSYWQIDINPVTDQPDRIWVLPSQCVTPVTDDGFPIGYAYKVAKRPDRYVEVPVVRRVDVAVPGRRVS